jgi:putative membrane protein
MKRFNFLLIGLVLSWSIQACNRSPRKADSVESAQDTTEVKANVEEDISEFMTTAASGGMMEVQLGQTAEKSAGSQAVKDFGAMMVRDHSKANDELKTLASSKNITLPTVLGKDHQKMANDVIALKGAKFDDKYMEMMVDDHKEDIDHFEKAAKFKDAEVSAFANKTLPVLRKHLEEAERINKTLKD